MSDNLMRRCSINLDRGRRSAALSVSNPRNLGSFKMSGIGPIPDETSFIDFGCSKGNSVLVFERKFGGPGIGIDINDKKLAAAREAGVDARKVDLFAEPLPSNCVRFVTMIHVLEHLHSEKQVKTFLEQGIRAAREFVLIRFPYFDADGILAHHGVKFYHSDWRSHPMPLSTLQIYRCLRDVATDKVRGFYIAGRQPLNGKTEGIIPLDTPPDTQRESAATYGAYDLAEIAMPVFKELAVLIILKDDPKLPTWLMKQAGVSPKDVLVSMPSLQGL